MITRLLKPVTSQSFFLFGPRGTGKTTWVKFNYPNSIYLDLLDSSLFTRLLADPSRLTSYIPPGNKEYVVLDEVQRVPELLNEVHRLIESEKIKFILTGSSARKLRSKGHNLLAGRALTYFMHPLTALELRTSFNLKHAIQFGLLPSATKEADPSKYLSSYVATYLEQEISQEGLTRNLSAFSRFLETASFSQGSIINMSAIARDSSVERKVVENYFSILQDLLIGYKLPPFTKRAKRRLMSQPKFYFFDTGVYRSIRPAGPLDAPEEIGGIALETLFFQNLLAINQSLGLNYDLYYYRTATGIEVDFIAYGEKGIIAFEVKHSSKFSESMLKGLKHFLQDYPKSKAYLLYMGDKVLYQDNITVLPIKNALETLDKILVS
ncbi:MAG: ATP-binding protein [Patescibacteria group bacterium]